MSYRPDIDGLRAVAVTAVVAYHALPGHFPGGFAGVDVFFVISGFLISQLILSDLERGTFSFGGFYGRRIRRIFPALAVMLVCCAIAGWLFLLPDEWSQLGRDLMASVAFVANLSLALERARYFVLVSHSRPLLHLWSLGVEEQFYFFWPLLLFSLRRRRKATIVSVLAALAVVSFAINLLLVTRETTLTFYSPVTRIWELSLGALLAIAAPARVQPRLRAELASWTGLLLCGASVFLIHTQGFPGAWALAPTAAALLLIGAGEGAFVNRRLLAARPLVLVGLISYPLYLWHWPLLAFARIWRNGEMSRSVIVACVAASIVLAAATYRFVELPIRSRPVRSRPLHIVVATMVVLATLGLLVKRGWANSRLQGGDVARCVTAAQDWHFPFGENFDRLDHFEAGIVPGRSGPAIVFIGDSHMQELWPRIEALSATQATPELRFVTNGGCPPLRGVKRSARASACAAFLDFAMGEARRPDAGTVVFGASWTTYLQGRRADETARALDELSSEIATLVQTGKHVVVILSMPAEPAFAPRSMVSRLTGRLTFPPPMPLDAMRAKFAAVNEAVRHAAERGGATVVDPLPDLCPQQLCRADLPDDRLIYIDGNHVRPFYIREHAAFVDRIVTPPPGGSSGGRRRLYWSV